MKRFKTNNTILSEQELYLIKGITIGEVERLKTIQIGEQVGEYTRITNAPEQV